MSSVVGASAFVKDRGNEVMEKAVPVNWNVDSGRLFAALEGTFVPTMAHPEIVRRVVPIIALGPSTVNISCELL
jgi:hypothetical protein